MERNNMPDLPIIDQPAIVVTASRAEEAADRTPASVTLIDAEKIERLGAPLVADYLRLVPSAAVSTSGPAGSQTQLRIRGAEANHSLLFVDGIRANDPAAGNEPRFELLNADLASRIEVVRGPQSALWGSEAVGGVVSVEGAPPGADPSQLFAEYGSHSTWRAAGRTSLGDRDRGLSLGLAGQGSDGIDAFDGGGDRDGYRNWAGRIAGRYRRSPALLVGGSGFAIRGLSQFDGYNQDSFQHDDTLDETHNRLSAGRIFADWGNRDRSYAMASASLLKSSNRNELDDVFLNRTSAGRRTLSIEGGVQMDGHRFIAAAEGEREQFEARDDYYGGLTNQDRTRRHRSLTLEWRGRKMGPFTPGLAVRRDLFSAFKDATSARASLVTDVGRGISLAANYAEGIAQPTFFDLYGFFPGSYVGNPSLKPERSRGWEISARYRRNSVSASLTYYRQRLRDEIVDSPDFTSTVNADGISTRRGVELELGWLVGPALRLAGTYTHLDANEQKVAGADPEREHRRPRHTGSLSADGMIGRWSYGAAVSFVGKHRDRRDSAPYELVNLSSYWVASANLAYRLSDALEANIRISNALDDRHEDLVAYRTEGRTIHAGLRLAFGH
jgi:vitamin B12 transporter